ncbi:hypothetical protein GCM10010358_15430 [Streptomyces minutiscleroticus]|uniref:Uncharacterized protein n=1 Tax=Streptomyces minutiscleroticus TaxID=68238 RepID=A0A918KGR7_9ACTN|nr:hypothetical protein [Streptomyces minutiscleroticus]GGX62007.1 hypothetical protein GCM10010358_15430 [Streptomyces minutiscleroticus]
MPAEDLETGFQRLEDGLPERGRKVTDHGEDSSADENLELTADSEKDRFSVDAFLHVTGASGEENPALQVTVVSGCFRASDGANLDGES